MPGKVKMPKFSGETRCPKCGGEVPPEATHYKPADFVGTEKPDAAAAEATTPYSQPKPFERLERMCPRCGYSWDESTLDTQS